MKRYRLLTLVLCFALVGFNVVLACSGERNKISDEWRVCASTAVALFGFIYIFAQKIKPILRT